MTMLDSLRPRGAREQLAVGLRSAEPLQRFDVRPVADPRRSAVLALFGLRGGSEAIRIDDATAADLDLLLEIRADTLRAHPGEVSFPGGSADPGDVDAIDTALREAEEETGLDRTGVEIIDTLADLPLVPNNHVVTPVVAWRTRTMPLTAMDPAETREVRLASVGEMLDPANRFTAVFRHDTGEFRGPAFDIGGATVWGFTAIVIDHIFTAAGWTREWNVGTERDIFTLR